MRKVIIFGLIFAFFLGPGFIWTPDYISAEKEETPLKTSLRAVAGEDVKTSVEEVVSFDASETINPRNLPLTYIWDFGDGNEAEGERTSHPYSRPGEYKVSLTVKSGKNIYQDSLSVFVYNDTVVFISDGSKSSKILSDLENYAKGLRILLVNIQDTRKEPDYVIENGLAEKLTQYIQDLARAEIIITWTENSRGLTALSKFTQELDPSDLKNVSFADKAIVNIDDLSFDVLSPQAQSTFDVLQPKFVALSQNKAIKDIIGARSTEKVIPVLKNIKINQGIDYKIVGSYSERAMKKLGFTNFLSHVIDFMVNEGVPINTIALVLMLPVIATIVALSRQILGIKAFGIYTPTIITLAFLATGLKYGLFVFLVVLAAGTLTRIFLKRFRLLYLPRMAIVLSIVSLSIIGMLTYAASSRRTVLISMSIFPMLILITLVEKFVAAQIKRGLLTAITLSLETLAISVFCYYVMSWEILRNFILIYPEIIFLSLLFNFFLGKWTGLRFFEYVRFRKVVKG